jgi:hypothetical protein
MGVSKELNRLRERLESGELTPEQYEEKKRHLQEESISRVQSFWQRMGEARRWKLELVRGTVLHMTFLGGANKAALNVDGREIELGLAEDSIQISVGDMVLLACSIRDPLHSGIYYNETTGAGSLESTHKTSRLLLAVGWLGVLVGGAILTTVVLAARRELAFFSASGMFHVLLYLVSIVGGGAVVVLGACPSNARSA